MWRVYFTAVGPTTRLDLFGAGTRSTVSPPIAMAFIHRPTGTRPADGDWQNSAATLEVLFAVSENGDRIRRKSGYQGAPKC
jgi:hypothetical protein